MYLFEQGIMRINGLSPKNAFTIIMLWYIENRDFFCGHHIKVVGTSRSSATSFYLVQRCIRDVIFFSTTRNMFFVQYIVKIDFKWPKKHKKLKNLPESPILNFWSLPVRGRSHNTSRDFQPFFTLPSPHITHGHKPQTPPPFLMSRHTS